jgi:hypothetical protein
LPRKPTFCRQEKAQDVRTGCQFLCSVNPLGRPSDSLTAFDSRGVRYFDKSNKETTANAISVATRTTAPGQDRSHAKRCNRSRRTAVYVYPFSRGFILLIERLPCRHCAYVTAEYIACLHACSNSCAEASAIFSAGTIVEMCTIINASRRRRPGSSRMGNCLS